jgi:hypothetical protein
MGFRFKPKYDLQYSTVLPIRFFRMVYIHPQQRYVFRGFNIAIKRCIGVAYSKFFTPPLPMCKH